MTELVWYIQHRRRLDAVVDRHHRRFFYLFILPSASSSNNNSQIWSVLFLLFFYYVFASEARLEKANLTITANKILRIIEWCLRFVGSHWFHLYRTSCSHLFITAAVLSSIICGTCGHCGCLFACVSNVGVVGIGELVRCATGLPSGGSSCGNLMIVCAIIEDGLSGTTNLNAVPYQDLAAKWLNSCCMNRRFSLFYCCCTSRKLFWLCAKVCSMWDIFVHSVRRTAGLVGLVVWP